MTNNASDPVNRVSRFTLSDGNTVVQNTINSPIFDSTTDYNQGGTDIGDTQYEDAVQRASLWGTVSGNQGYHVLLGAPTVEPLQTIKVSGSYGTVATDFGVWSQNFTPPGPRSPGPHREDDPGEEGGAFGSKST